jgi:hypothetical protein
VQSTLKGGRDFILARIAADGSALLFSTLLGGHNGGGTEFTGTHNLGLDAAGNAYLCAETDATDFPGTAGFFQPTNAGGTDHIFAKVKVTPPTALLAATYVGGPGRDGEMQGCVVDAAGNVVATATSAGSGTGYPTTPGALQSDNDGGNDVVLVQLAADFKSLRYATYLGGSGDDQGRSATVTKSGLVVVGMTQSANFDVLNALQPTHAENPIVDFDGFVAKFSFPKPISTSSASATITATTTRSPTLTAPTFTVTATGTNTVLPSTTATPPGTPTLTFTLTATRTSTITVSTTPTRSGTPSPTLTVSVTATPTPVQTPTGTASAVPTATISSSVTVTPNPATETATPASTPTATAVPSLTATVDSGPVRGDLDGDGYVTDADLHALIRALFAPNPPSAADVNVDGRVSAADVAALVGAL